MNLTSLIIAIGIIIVIFLIIHFAMKALKIGMALIIIVLVFGIWFYGFSGFFDKVADVKDKIPELGVQKIARSITGCTTDQDCAYIANNGDCRMVKDYCNNIVKEENYQKIFEEDILEEDCNRTIIEFEPLIECECKFDKEREGKIKQWLGNKIEESVGYTYCWEKKTNSTEK